MKKFFAILFASFLVGMAIAAGYLFTSEKDAAPQGVTIEAIGDMPESSMDDVQQAVTLFTDDMTKNGAPLRHAVTVYVAATQEDYRRVIVEQFEQSADEARAIADVSGGWTGGRRGLTALNGAAGVMKTASDRKSTAGHELFHQLQL